MSFLVHSLGKGSYKAFMESRGGDINCFMGVTAKSLCEEAWIEGRVENDDYFCSVPHLLFLYSLTGTCT